MFEFDLVAILQMTALQLDSRQTVHPEKHGGYGLEDAQHHHPTIWHTTM